MLTQLVLFRLFSSVMTLYMMAIILRWLGPWLELDLQTSRLRFIPAITDPLIQAIRKMLPNMGPMDWAPIAALVAVFFLRTIGQAMLLPPQTTMF